MSRRIEVDGASGEGGGQILRSSLTLALLTGKACRVSDIRAGRRKPGLLRQHFTAARAAAEISGGSLIGGEIGSSALTFEPGVVRGGEYRFAISSAGSTLLVLQTILLPLVQAKRPSKVVVEGGTHNPGAPSFDFFDRVFLPILRSMGAKVDAQLERPGFFPAGGGRIVVEIEPSALSPLELLERGELDHRRARVLTAQLPRRVAKGELAALRRRLSWPEEAVTHDEVADSVGPGNVILLEAGFGGLLHVVASYGRRGVPGDRVVKEAIDELRGFLAVEAPVGRHLADQLLLPAYQAGGGCFRTLAPSQHTLTNAEVLKAFTGCQVKIEREEQGSAWRVDVARSRAEAQEVNKS